LAFNMAQNGCTGMRAFNVAIGRKLGRSTLTINPAIRGQNSLLGIPGASGLRTAEVDVWTLPHLVESARCTRIDAMKMDIEGMEEAGLQPFFDTVPPALWPRLLILESKESEADHRPRALVEEHGVRVARRAGFNLIFERHGGTDGVA
jgi:hypothetical protein